jgi:hypothetical protein
MFSKGRCTVGLRTGHKNPEWKERYSSTLSLTLSLDGVGGKHHVQAAFPPGKRNGIHDTGGWVAPPDGCGKSYPNRGSIPGPSST